MPVSDIANIAQILYRVSASNPKSVLELGVGFGKYGVLVREIQEAVNGRCNKNDFKNLLVGVEGFPQYNNDNWANYNSVLTQDFSDESNWKDYAGYDMVLMIDSLEHVEKVKAKKLLQFLIDNNREVIVSVPLGHCPQGAVFGNVFETHQDDWSLEDFTDFRCFNMTKLHQATCVVYSFKR